MLEALALHVRWCLWPPGIAMHYAAIRSFAIVVTPHAAPHSRTTTAARVSQLYAILTLTSAESQVRSPLCCHDRRGNRRMPPPPSLLLPSTALAKEGKNERSSYCLANLGNTKFSGASSYSIGFFGKTVVYYRHCMKCLPIYFLKNSQSWVAIGLTIGFTLDFFM